MTVPQPRLISDAYALIPRKVVQSAAYQALPDWAVRVLLAYACQYNGRNNGRLVVTTWNFDRLGVRARWHVRASTRLLEATGLIERTDEPTTYALTWLARSIVDDDEVVEPSDRWQEWEKPKEWRAIVSEAKRDAKTVH